ncbi:MAG: glycosyltransferase family 2 protein [Spirosomataceae bacterium]
MHPAQVTIIMPVFNGAATLKRAVGSILAQSYPHWKLLILEDGSTDNTLFLAQSFEDTRIQIISDGKHLGIVARLNQGIDLVESPYMARMDADDVASADRLTKQLTFLETNATIDLAGCAIRILDNNGRAKGVHIFPTSHAQIVARPWLKSLSVAHPTWCGRTGWFKKWHYQTYLRNEDQELLLRAAADSQYANLSEVLLDYYDSYSVLKNLQARWGWILVLWTHYAKKGDILHFLAGITMTKLKFFRSLFAT